MWDGAQRRADPSLGPTSSWNRSLSRDDRGSLQTRDLRQSSYRGAHSSARRRTRSLGPDRGVRHLGLSRRSALRVRARVPGAASGWMVRRDGRNPRGGRGDRAQEDSKVRTRRVLRARARGREWLCRARPGPESAEAGSRQASGGSWIRAGTNRQGPTPVRCVGPGPHRKGARFEETG